MTTLVIFGAQKKRKTAAPARINLSHICVRSQRHREPNPNLNLVPRVQ